MSVGHRLDAPTTLRFSGDMVVERYLNPVHKPGCGKHISPNCLCDVQVGTPAPMDKVPIAFANVGTVDDLTRVAADIWVRYDVLGPITSRYKDPNQSHNDRDYQFSIDLNDPAALTAAAEAIEGGASNEEAYYTHKLPRELAWVIRRAYGTPPPRWFPAELAVELLNDGYKLGEVSDMLFERFGKRWSRASVSYWYEKVTGSTITTMRSRSAREVGTLDSDEG